MNVVTITLVDDLYLNECCYAKAVDELYLTQCCYNNNWLTYCTSINIACLRSLLIK